ncbi:MAG: CorA family divalent cation transporter [Candidatus Absconditabacteria bacterium]|nr:CorA family divalent cation transporter [Candidatus Absconditabacteria bacterium]MDD3868121.1 CorA family divalent cation transporter [Candidatus Absconditabacteria bacterium]
MNSGTLKIGGISWTHFVDPKEKDVDILVDQYDLHEIIEQDFLDFTTQDKIDVYDDCIFLVMRFPKYNARTKKHFANHLHAILGKDFIITVTSHVTNNIQSIQDTYRKELEEDGETEEFKLSPYYILYKIIDAMYDKALIGLTKFSQDLIKIEDKAMDSSTISHDLLSELLIKKRNAVLMRHLISPHTEILRELQVATMNFYEGDLDVYFEDLQYKTDKILSLISIVKENTESLFDVSDTLTTMKTNNVISILTIFTVILGILTRLSGMYGMNVDLPFQDDPWAFTLLCFTMVGIAAVAMLYFRKKKRF